jgi:hypothetical protein
MLVIVGEIDRRPAARRKRQSRLCERQLVIIRRAECPEKGLGRGAIAETPARPSLPTSMA